MDTSNHLIDSYTGNKELASNTSPDHIKPLSKFHKDGGFMVSKEDKANFATDKENLASTRRDINQSMSDEDKIKWLDKKQGKRDIDNAEEFGVDRGLVKKQYEKGEIIAEKHLPNKIDKAKFYSKDITKTGAKEGAKMGLQQALGLVFCEFFEASFVEIKDIYANGFVIKGENSQFFNSLKIRLNRIVKKIANKWKDALKAFGDGFISGFLSNLVTVVINMFVRTGKRVV
ncbi:MAG: lactate permease, partial [Proteobacteria bacterium]|nr:lactate permease [Pseudomonadota bacterium]